MKVLTLQPELHLSSFNVFDIGANKEYFNEGLIQHHCRNKLCSDLEQLIDTLQRQTTDIALTLHTRTLKFLVEEQPELLEQLKTLLQTNSSVHLATQAPYATTTEVLSKAELEEQVTSYTKKLQEKLGVKATVLLLDKPSEALANDLQLELADEEQSMEAFLAGTTHHYKQLGSELQDHVLSELKALAPHIHKTEDKELSEHFAQLASTHVIRNVHPDHGETPYDHYTTLMSILHDVAHRIQAARAIQTGVFITPHQLGASPSAILR